MGVFGEDETNWNMKPHTIYLSIYLYIYEKKKGKSLERDRGQDIVVVVRMPEWHGNNKTILLDVYSWWGQGPGSRTKTCALWGYDCKCCSRCSSASNCCVHPSRVGDFVSDRLETTQEMQA